MLHVIVAYDVVCDRRRRRLQKALGEYLEHVQFSVFEGPIDERSYLRMVARAGRLIDRETDSIRIYRVCDGCGPMTRVLGQGDYVTQEGDVIVWPIVGDRRRITV